MSLPPVEVARNLQVAVNIENRLWFSRTRSRTPCITPSAWCVSTTPSRTRDASRRAEWPGFRGVSRHVPLHEAADKKKAASDGSRGSGPERVEPQFHLASDHRGSRPDAREHVPHVECRDKVLFSTSRKT